MTPGLTEAQQEASMRYADITDADIFQAAVMGFVDGWAEARRALEQALEAARAEKAAVEQAWDAQTARAEKAEQALREARQQVADYGNLAIDERARAEAAEAALRRWQPLVDEIERARAKYPGNEFRLLALQGEVNEVLHAFVTHDFEQVRAEALQVAATAIRLYEEGDSALGAVGGADDAC